MIDIEKAKEEMKEYVKGFDNTNPKIALKAEHVQRTSKIAEEIAKSLKLSEEDVNLAALIGLLHDIGRFEQLKEYDTFRDKDSINHAEEGVKVLFEQGLIRNFIETDEYDEIIKKAIINHNRSAYDMDKVLSKRELMHAKIVRDADKLDIYHVLNTENLQVLYGENPNKEKITDEIYREFMEDKYLNYKNIHSNLDVLVSHFAYIYDFNYVYSLQRIKKENYLSRLYGRFNIENPEEKAKLEKIYLTSVKFLDRELTRKRLLNYYL